ncbi:MAG: hypothetical protein PUB25_08205, partial [Lachnospiraceae bacterium]|nr:hypothetical protein [Lachnospiraceae bacterium]
VLARNFRCSLTGFRLSLPHSFFRRASSQLSLLAHGLSPYKNTNHQICLQAGRLLLRIFARLNAFLNIITQSDFCNN